MVWVFLGAVGILLWEAPLWLLFAVSAAATFGLLMLLDAFLFRGELYENAWEPIVVSGIVQLAPWLVVPWLVDIRWTDASSFAVLAGVLNMSSLVLYFRAMKTDQDAVVISVMWNLLIATVPIGAFILLGEQLSLPQYAGIALLFLGATISVWKKTAVRAKIIGLMTLAVVLSSLYTIAEKESFNILEQSGIANVFWNMFLFFSLGEGLVAVVASGIVHQRGGMTHLRGLVKKFWPVLLFIEIGYFLFTGLFSRAVSLGPVSLVIAVDGLAGAFVIVFGILIAHLFRKTRYAAITRDVEMKQTVDAKRKVFGILVLVIGAYLVAG
jgi:uncharacterized membrane protein